MSDLFIFDGYNLMHALEPGGITAGNIEEKRVALVELVVNYLATTGDRAFVVFDSSGGEAASYSKITGTPVTVCYASAKESADILIGKLVQQELQNQEKKGDSCIRVVSADWEVQRGAMQERVERIPPRRFIADLKKNQKRVANYSKKDRMRWKLEHKVDIETLRKLEDMRRGKS